MALSAAWTRRPAAEVISARRCCTGGYPAMLGASGSMHERSLLQLYRGVGGNSSRLVASRLDTGVADRTCRLADPASCADDPKRCLRDDHGRHPRGLAHGRAPPSSCRREVIFAGRLRHHDASRVRCSTAAPRLRKAVDLRHPLLFAHRRLAGDQLTGAELAPHNCVRAGNTPAGP